MQAFSYGHYYYFLLMFLFTHIAMPEKNKLNDT